MTIDRAALRRTAADLYQSRDNCEYNAGVETMRTAIASLIDELDAKDRRIAELEAASHAARSGAAESVMVHDAQVATIDDLELRLSIATELNVGDRKRIAELEALNAAAARAVDVMDDIGEQARARIAALETALTDAINWIADRSSPDSILVDRLRKLVPLEET